MSEDGDKISGAINCVAALLFVLILGLSFIGTLMFCALEDIRDNLKDLSSISYQLGNIERKMVDK
jgi:hypothetical protein